MENTFEAYKAIYKAGSRDQFCLAIGVTSTSPKLLEALLIQKGIALEDVDIVGFNSEDGEQSEA